MGGVDLKNNINKKEFILSGGKIEFRLIHSTYHGLSCNLWSQVSPYHLVFDILHQIKALRWAGAGQVVVDVITADDAVKDPGLLLARADLARRPLTSLSRPLATAGDRCSTKSK